jgi:uncharacterized SAM-binding protein YcdF (DUF218 family)
MSHTLEFLVRPTFWLYLILAWGLICLWRNGRETRGRLLWLTIPFVIGSIISLPVVAHLALGTLEWSYPMEVEISKRPDMVVVLSGYMFAPQDGQRDRIELGPDTYYRCLHALAIYRQVGGCSLLLSGGIVEGKPGGTSLAEAMRDFLVRRGVKPEDLTVEKRSETTYENAVECAKILRERGVSHIMLVTDAKHLWRATLCFRRQGIEVAPSACNFATARFRNRFEDYLPSPRGAAQFLDAYHEWFGVLYYQLRGWI